MERNFLGTKRPGNETSKICVSFLGTKRLGNEKSSHHDDDEVDKGRGSRGSIR